MSYKIHIFWRLSYIFSDYLVCINHLVLLVACIIFAINLTSHFVLQGYTVDGLPTETIQIWRLQEHSIRTKSFTIAFQDTNITTYTRHCTTRHFLDIVYTLQSGSHRLIAKVRPLKTNECYRIYPATTHCIEDNSNKQTNKHTNKQTTTKNKINQLQLFNFDSINVVRLVFSLTRENLS